MKTIPYLLLLLFYSITICAQNTDVIIEDVRPTIDGNKFPLLKFQKSPKVEDKINSLLQLENLEHLPNQYKTNPFEKVVGGHEGFNNTVQFYDYTKNSSPKNILSLTLYGEATGAYSEGFETYYNFDLRTGKKLNVTDFLTKNGIQEITKKLNQNVRTTIEDFLVPVKKTLKEESENKEDEGMFKEQIALYSDCLENIDENTIEYYDFYFDKKSITFVRGRCSNHAMRALDDLNRFRINFPYDEIKKHSTKYGLSLLNGEANIPEIKSPEGKFFKGKINNKYAVTVLLSKINSDNSLEMQYWYDKIKIPIEWSGSFRYNHFSLVEYDYYDEEKQKWIIRAKIEADLLDNKIIGTWTNIKTKEVFSIELTE